MEAIPILVAPLEYPLNAENALRCYNCGSTAFRIQKVWSIIKAESEEQPAVDVSRVEYWCAVCGKKCEGIDHYTPEQCEGEYDSREDALSAKIAEEIRGNTPLDKVNKMVA